MTIKVTITGIRMTTDKRYKITFLYWEITEPIKEPSNGTGINIETTITISESIKNPKGFVASECPVRAAFVPVAIALTVLLSIFISYFLPGGGEHIFSLAWQNIHKCVYVFLFADQKKLTYW